MADASQRDASKGHPRLRLICGAYGTNDLPGLLFMVDRVLTHMGNAQAATAMIGPEAAQRLAEGGHFAHWQAEEKAFSSQRPALSRSLILPQILMPGQTRGATPA